MVYFYSAANAARCDLFLLRRSYFGKTTFHLVALGDNGKVLTQRIVLNTLLPGYAVATMLLKNFLRHELHANGVCGNSACF